jgi:murein DD-endopeptidase MepM/ murein hydrolase activator NlpD
MKKIIVFFLAVLALYLAVSLYFLDKVYFLCPVEYPGEVIIRNDGYGNGYFGASRSGNRLHKGVDLFAAVGTPVFVCRRGRVISAQENKGMGKYVVIRHRGGLVTIYGHLSEIAVNKGKTLRQGDLLGRVGKTGNANLRNIQSHLHFEVRKDGRCQDPLEYLQ